MVIIASRFTAKHRCDKTVRCRGGLSFVFCPIWVINVSQVQEIYNMHEVISFVFFCNVKYLLTVQLLILWYDTDFTYNIYTCYNAEEISVQSSMAHFEKFRLNCSTL